MLSRSTGLTVPLSPVLLIVLTLLTLKRNSFNSYHFLLNRHGKAQILMGIHLVDAVGSHLASCGLEYTLGAYNERKLRRLVSMHSRGRCEWSHCHERLSCYHLLERSSRTIYLRDNGTNWNARLTYFWTIGSGAFQGQVGLCSKSFGTALTV
jgi:hypothetical protein